jgi:hypothetical protein
MALVLTAAACGSSSGGSVNGGNGGDGTKVAGGTATYALPPNPDAEGLGPHRERDQ